MDFQTRKIHILEEVLKIKNDTELAEIESTLYGKKRKSKQKINYTVFSGVLTKKEADSMNKAIQEACEQINPNEWK